MLKSVILVFLLGVFSANTQKLNVEVLFESLCPDSLRFISEQLYPNWNDISEYVDLKFVPFGKSASLEGGKDFVCQHGPQECKGNRILSCAIENLPNQNDQVEFVNCFMQIYKRTRKHPMEDAQQCSHKVNLDFKQLIGCYNSEQGTHLQLNAEKSTVKFQPRFIPTVLYNGEFKQQLQDISLVNFRGLVCELIGKTFPESCKKLSTISL
ncbi:unnamed protein product [Brassicogethes aeneus]|uniref:Uncharacterized protein n=1 Tax=Brassicogethes aeneus TaxID=1431903 RepID=A0A9P0BBR4_BRAAE|nr:unnamed protein product [Brassicogethes aeneus]